MAVVAATEVAAAAEIVVVVVAAEAVTMIAVVVVVTVIAVAVVVVKAADGKPFLTNLFQKGPLYSGPFFVATNPALSSFQSAPSPFPHFRAFRG